jgi:diphthine methyl ester acylhydrolase
MDALKKFSDCITPICMRVLDDPPSCLEFVPREHNPRSEYFIVGTYTLLSSGNHASEKNKQELQGEEAEIGSATPQDKVGSLKLFKIDHDNL